MNKKDQMMLNDERRLKSVIEFAENVLEYGRDYYRDNPSPLFCDGINIDTLKQITWKFSDIGEVVISNLATQQNLFQTLTALSSVTQNPKYKEAAKAAIKYHFDYLVDEGGLLQWGGHKFIDLKTLNIVGPVEKEYVHELKNCFPYYDLMYEVNPEGTEKFIKAFWNAHIYNWEELDMGRHGKYGLELGPVWEHEKVQLPPLRESLGLSFINAGNDLIYSAATLYRLNGDHKALEWAKHLAYQYVLARNKDTGLGAYQFTQAKKTHHTEDDTVTLSRYGDRAKRQFGPEFGEVALEGNMLRAGGSLSIYGRNALMQLSIAKDIGEEAKDILSWTHEGLLNFSKYAYMKETNSFKTMFTDGTDLTGYIFKRSGYYGVKGQEIKSYFANGAFLLSYAKAFFATGDGRLWEMVRDIAVGNDLGDLGKVPKEVGILNYQTSCLDPLVLFAVIELFRATNQEAYLDLGRKIADNLLEKHFYKGYFVEDKACVYAKFDRIEPLALITLQAAIDGKLNEVPNFLNGAGFISGGYLFPDGTFETVGDRELYTLKRGEDITSLIKNIGLPDGN
jgi:pectate lyase